MMIMKKIYIYIVVYFFYWLLRIWVWDFVRCGRTWLRKQRQEVWIASRLTPFGMGMSPSKVRYVNTSVPFEMGVSEVLFVLMFSTAGIILWDCRIWNLWNLLGIERTHCELQGGRPNINMISIWRPKNLINLGALIILWLWSIYSIDIWPTSRVQSTLKPAELHANIWFMSNKVASKKVP